MAEIVNLNRARKQKTRADREKQAAENRVKFGRSRDRKRAEAAVEEKAERDLSAHRLTPDERE